MRVGMVLDQSRDKNDEKLTALTLLRNCITTVSPPENGPDPYPSGFPGWEHALSCDGLLAAISLREATYPGEPLTMSLRCPRCKKMLPHEHTTVNLRTVLADYIIPVPEASVRAFVAGNRIPVRVGDHEFVISLQTGLDAPADLESRPIDAIAQRVVSIDGVEDREQVVAVLKTLSLGELDDLIDELLDADGGVLDFMKARCPNKLDDGTSECGWEAKVRIPFLELLLVSPSEERRSEKRTRRTRKALREAAIAATGSKSAGS